MCGACARAAPNIRRRAPATPAQRWVPAATPHSNSTGASPASPANDSIRDVTERFQPQIVSDITGHGPDDPIPVGAVRVGGKHSPFVAQPVSRFNAVGMSSAGLTHAGATPARGVGSAGSSPGMQTSPGLAFNVLQPYGAAAGFAGRGAAGLGILGAMGEYVHYEVTQLPSRPLPPVITPAHLKPTPKEKVEIRVIRYLLWSYLSIVKKTYQDMVPKVVMSMLVNRAREEIASELVHRLYATIVQPDALLKGALRVVHEHVCARGSLVPAPYACVLQRRTKSQRSAVRSRIICACCSAPWSFLQKCVISARASAAQPGQPLHCTQRCPVPHTIHHPVGPTRLAVLQHHKACH